MPQKQLNEHPFIAQAYKNIHPLVLSNLDKLKSRLDEGGGVREPGQLALSKNEYFNFMVFRRATNLTTAFDMLQEVQYFITWLPPASKFRKLGISQERWIDYHYSYYLIVMASIVDLSLLLTNEVFRLGYPEKACTTIDKRELPGQGDKSSRCNSAIRRCH